MQQPRREVAAIGQRLHDLSGIRLLEGGEHRHPLEALVAERQEVTQAGAGPPAQGIVDERALQVEREDLGR